MYTKKGHMTYTPMYTETQINTDAPMQKTHKHIVSRKVRAYDVWEEDIWRRYAACCYGALQKENTNTHTHSHTLVHRNVHTFCIRTHSINPCPIKKKKKRSHFSRASLPQLLLSVFVCFFVFVSEHKLYLSVSEESRHFSRITWK